MSHSYSQIYSSLNSSFQSYREYREFKKHKKLILKTLCSVVFGRNIKKSVCSRIEPLPQTQMFKSLQP